MTDTAICPADAPGTGLRLSDVPLARDLVPTDRRLLPCSLEVLNEGADIIQAAGGFVDAKLRSDRGACVAVAYMAALHGTDLIGAASQAYNVGGRLAFMAQYINALLQRHLDGNPEYVFEGAGATRQVRVTATPKGGKPLTYTSPQLGQIKIKNSPLWVTDPDQQLCYYGVRAWARRHKPDVLLGIYAVEELQAVTIRDVTPAPAADFDEGSPEPEIEDAHVEEEPFEPSGGFVTNDPPTEDATRAELAADDILAWSETMKADAREAKTPEALQKLWDDCETNRRKLWRTERAEHDALELAFKDRLADLS